MNWQANSIRRVVRLVAASCALALLGLGRVPSACAQDQKDDAIRKLEEQLRKATERLDELQKENAKLRDMAEELRRAVDLERKKAADQLAGATDRVVKAIAAVEAIKKDAARVRDENKKLLQKIEEEKTQALQALADEAVRVQAARKEAQVQAAVAAEQRAVAEKQAAAAQELQKEATLHRERAVTALTERALLQERAAKLAARVAELEKENLRLQERLFLKPLDKNPDAPKNPARNPPPGNIEGTVKSVDAGGLMLVTVGTDAGLEKGHTLEVYRLAPKPQYVGTVVIVEVKAKEAVAKPVGKLAGPAMVGDMVGSKIIGN
jgi:hypothetical protein